MKDYHINIFYSEEDEGYIADIPDLRFCSAFGNTPEEALKQVQIAKAVWIEAARVEGKLVPRPKHKPIIYQTASSLMNSNDQGRSGAVILRFAQNLSVPVGFFASLRMTFPNLVVKVHQGIKSP